MPPAREPSENRWRRQERAYHEGDPLQPRNTAIEWRPRGEDRKKELEQGRNHVFKERPIEQRERPQGWIQARERIRNAWYYDKPSEHQSQKPRGWVFQPKKQNRQADHEEPHGAGVGDVPAQIQRYPFLLGQGVSGPKYRFNDERRSTIRTLDGQLDSIARVVHGDLCEGGEILYGASVDLYYSVTRPQSGALNGAAPLDAFNQVAMLGLEVLIIKAQLHGKLPESVVHPKGYVKNAGGGEERCQNGQQRF